MDRQRTLTLSMDMGMGRGSGGFLIDSRSFDVGRVDQTVDIGTVEEWDLVNSSTMDHPFHLHIWPMQACAEATRTSPVSTCVMSWTSRRAAQ